MSTEQKDLEQNALASRLDRTWSSLKEGKLISYRLMALLLILVALIGVWWYVSAERKKANSQRWLRLDEANSLPALEDYAKVEPNSVQARLARLLIAREQLGPTGIDLLSSPLGSTRKRGVENIEKAREALPKLAEEFQNDVVFKAECLYGLARAEAALVAVPAKGGQLTEFKGDVNKVIEYLDKVVAVAPDTPWATEAKKLAETLRRDPNEFIRVQRSMFRPPEADLPKLDDPLAPILPGVPTPGGTKGDPHAPFLPGLPGGK